MLTSDLSTYICSHTKTDTYIQRNIISVYNGFVAINMA